MRVLDVVGAGQVPVVPGLDRPFRGRTCYRFDDARPRLRVAMAASHDGFVEWLTTVLGHDPASR